MLFILISAVGLAFVVFAVAMCRAAVRGDESARGRAEQLHNDSQQAAQSSRGQD